MTRLKKRRHAPAPEPFDYAVACQHALTDGLEALANERGWAFLSAANAGWSMREIGNGTGLSASTVCRIINHAEGGST